MPFIPVALACLTLLLVEKPVFAAVEPLHLSVYATAGDIQRYLGSPEGRRQAEQVLKGLRVSRLFLEGRRGDEYVSPDQLRQVRDFFVDRGILCAGGIATVPGNTFGVRQNGGLGWLNWENEKTRRDVTQFFVENAPVFDTLIVDDFYCTGDTSTESQAARGSRSWGEYRRDLLVSLINPLIVQPVRSVRPSARLILKFPQWYDRFHVFGYDPPRMSEPFDQIWVGTEVRDPKTRRMGFVQPTEGYVNFCWITSVAGAKVRGAWFDHIECSAQNFVDQACQSVLAGARELTLFHLGDLIEGHPGDALLASEWPKLCELAAHAAKQPPRGISFYKPPGSEADENLFLADYLGMIGLPIVPEARYPETAKAVFLPVQAAADRDVVAKMRRHLERGATLILTPALIRALGDVAGQFAGVEVESKSVPKAASGVTIDDAAIGRKAVSLAIPLELDASLKATGSTGVIHATVDGQSIPLLTRLATRQGSVFVFNVRTFSEQDYKDAGEWLLAPKPRGLPEIPQPLADALRAAWLPALGVDLQSPAGVALYLFGKARCVYSFHHRPVPIRLDGQLREVPASQWLWVESQ